MSAHLRLAGRARTVVIVSAVLVLLAVVLVAARLWSYIGERSETDSRLTAIAEQNQINGRILVDCTTPTPKPTPEDPEPAVHECYERGGRATGAAVAELRRSIDCVALYAIGRRPPPCADVDARMDALSAGENPFATPPGGNP